jgi:hypothetical protein
MLAATLALGGAYFQQEVHIESHENFNKILP